MLISFIISTYNRHDALICVLESLNKQNNLSFEVIVADDGSTDETKKAVKEFRNVSKYHVEHVWQEDTGFHLAQIRNKAVAKSKGDYLVFLDGDCVAFPDFVDRHLLLAEKGYFVRGSRVMLSEEYTSQYINNHDDASKLSFINLVKLRFEKKINRILPLFYIPLGKIRKLKKMKWYGAKGCNIAIWRSDYFAVNGFDERYVGWGREDSDIVIRLIRSGVLRKEGIYAITVLHLWHSMSDRSQLSDNDEKLKSIQQSKATIAELGISQYAEI